DQRAVVIVRDFHDLDEMLREPGLPKLFGLLSTKTPVLAAEQTANGQCPATVTIRSHIEAKRIFTHALVVIRPEELIVTIRKMTGIEIEEVRNGHDGFLS